MSPLKDGVGLQAVSSVGGRVRSRGLDTSYIIRINIHRECRENPAFYYTHMLHLVLSIKELIVTLLMHL